MSSPLAHTAVGYLFWRSARRELPEARFALAFIVLSLLPDIDSLPGFLAGDLHRYHNNLSHSIFAGVAASALAGLVAGAMKMKAPLTWAAYGLLCYGTHILMDYLTVGRGLMLFWPFSADRYASPVQIFYGLRWSEGLWSSHHLLTLLTESLFIAALLLFLRRLRRARVVP